MRELIKKSGRIGDKHYFKEHENLFRGLFIFNLTGPASWKWIDHSRFHSNEVFGPRWKSGSSMERSDRFGWSTAYRRREQQEEKASSIHVDLNSGNHTTSGDRTVREHRRIIKHESTICDRQSLNSNVTNDRPEVRMFDRSAGYYLFSVTSLSIADVQLIIYVVVCVSQLILFMLLTMRLAQSYLTMLNRKSSFFVNASRFVCFAVNLVDWIINC